MRYRIFTQPKPHDKAVPARRKPFDTLASARKWAQEANASAVENGWPRKRFVIVQGQDVVAVEE